jgi:hypothetical protein
MRFRKHTAVNPGTDTTRDDVRDLAEALSLYRSAMHHIAERETLRRPLAQNVAEPRRMRTLQVIFAPALTVAVAAGVLVPLYSHLHHPAHLMPVAVTSSNAGTAVAAVDDSALLNQIDSDLSEDVPDAFRPLADLSDQSATTQHVSEKK